VRVERALEGGLNLGRAALDVMLNELLLKAHVMALDLSETRGASNPPCLLVCVSRPTSKSLAHDRRRTGPGAGEPEYRKARAARPGVQALRHARQVRATVRSNRWETRDSCSG